MKPVSGEVVKEDTMVAVSDATGEATVNTLYVVELHIFSLSHFFCCTVLSLVRLLLISRLTEYVRGAMKGPFLLPPHARVWFHVYSASKCPADAGRKRYTDSNAALESK